MALTTEEQLAEARVAYHNLATGQAVAEARDSDGTLVRYNRADMGRLAAYIATLENTIAGNTRPSGPMRIIA